MGLQMETIKYDLIVIGTGAGTKLVRPVAALGKNVAVVEKESLGGTCLNKGCIPSKMLLHPAEMVHQFVDAKRFHISSKAPSLDGDALLQEVFSKIAKESASIEPLYEKSPNVTLYKGTARFVGPKTIEVGNVRMQAERIVIATGARPKVPAISGLEGTPYWTYREFMQLKTLPRSVVVMGTGFIGVELGYFLAMFGVKVTFLTRGGLLSKEDEEVREYFTKCFSARHNVLFNTQVQKVSYDKESKQYTLEIEHEREKKTLQSEALLVATGVTPNVEELQLENTGIQTCRTTGFIQVDSFLETSCKGVYALGDCVGNYFFRHSANFEGQWLQSYLYGEQTTAIEYPPMPHAVFSCPQIASVGPTESELKEKGTSYLRVVQYYRDSAMGMALKSEGDFFKLLFSPETGRILAVHIVGHEAANLLHIPLAVMQCGGTCIDLANMVYVHPALAEVVRNAARKAVEMLDASCSKS